MKNITLSAAVFVALGLFAFAPVTVLAHCDTMGGPVISDAQKALDTGRVNYVLPWVQKKDEEEIRHAFEETLNVRKLSPQAKAFADRYFFETLVRIHRAGEGAPYTGIKPAGTDLGPAVSGADKALETGSVEPLVKLVNEKAAEGIRHRFERAMELKKHASHNVEAGREYVKAYVTYVHYAEGIYDMAASESAHHEGGGEDNATKHQHGE
ncbi:MAG TPA: DUF6448 family protein [Deltaproteobacteria bacterium]|jgi:hypothetical protein|nr:DUF6448 family protein [Deltaproteobacteria bacterium]HQI02639.1 DUF6448 family protein [Deltaproteobacteria bacterium]